jgi:hypothetical protein
MEHRRPALAGRVVARATQIALIAALWWVAMQGVKAAVRYSMG